MERNDKPVEGLRKCKAAFYKGGELHWVEGWFHRWASNYEEFDAICGNYTEAIVELEDGQIVTCVMDTVKFLDREERR